MITSVETHCVPLGGAEHHSYLYNRGCLHHSLSQRHAPWRALSFAVPYAENRRSARSELQDAFFLLCAISSGFYSYNRVELIAYTEQFNFLDLYIMSCVHVFLFIYLCSDTSLAIPALQCVSRVCVLVMLLDPGPSLDSDPRPAPQHQSSLSLF